MSEENRIRFAGLMEEYLNIPSFVCELIEKQLEDNKYKEVIEYVVQRRNEIENKEDYLSEQEKINRYLNLQQKVEQQEKEIDRLNKEYERIYNENCKLRENHNINDITLLDENERLNNIIKNKDRKIKLAIKIFENINKIYGESSSINDVIDVLKEE